MLIQAEITDVWAHMVPAVIASVIGLRSLFVSFRPCGYAFFNKKEALNVLTMTKFFTVRRLIRGALDAKTANYSS